MAKGTKNERIIVAIISIVLSTVLWLYIDITSEERRDFQITDIPVEIKNQQLLEEENLVIVPDQDLTIDLKIQGKENQKNKMTRENVKLSVDLDGISLKEGLNIFKIKVEKLPTSDSEIRSNDYLVLEINLEKNVEKDIIASSQIVINKENQHIVPQITINNPQVTVSGPKSVVERVNSVVAYGEESNIKGKISKDYPVKALDENGIEVVDVSINPGKVNVDIKVSEGKSVKINVKTVGDLPDGIKLISLKQDKEKIDVTGDVDLLNDIIYVETEPLDFSKITETTEVKLKIYASDGVFISPQDEFVNVKVTVEEVLEKEITKEFTVPFESIGLNENFEVTFAKETVNITISGLESEINKIKISDIVAVLDLSKYNADGDYKDKPGVQIDVNGTIEVEDISFNLKEIILEEPS